MDIVKMVLSLVGYLILSILVTMLLVNLIQTLTILKRSVKDKISFRDEFMNYKHFGLMNLAKWVIKDVALGKSYFKLYGIWCFTGYYGQGKSLGEVNFAFQLRKNHPDLDIKIYSNFNVKGQDGKVTCWEDILTLPKNTILLFDEIQSTFTSTKYKDFPIELLWKLTQCRKHGLAIFCTSPVYSRMSIQLRESTDFVVESKNVMNLDRLFKYTFFRSDKYESYYNSDGLLKPLRKREYIEFNHTMVARDIDYSLYDTTEQIDRWDIVDDDNKKTKSIDTKKLENDIYKRVMGDVMLKMAK